MCCKKDWGECLVGTGKFFSCGNEGHKDRDCLNMIGKVKGSGQASGSIVEDLKNNHFILSIQGVNKRVLPIW